MNRIPQTVCLLFVLALQFQCRSFGVEILEADPDLSVRLRGPNQTDVHFGANTLDDPQYGNHLLGSMYYEESKEALQVFGFQITESFLSTWKEQGQAQLLFSIIEFHEGDAHKICPIRVERLAAFETAEEAAAQLPKERLGEIKSRDLEVDRLYHFSLSFDPSLEPGDVVWIGLDGTNPCEPENHNLIIAGDLSSYPGGSPPMLVADSPETTSQTVYGMSLLQSLNRRFYAPRNPDTLVSVKPEIPHWANPFRTTRKLETLNAFRLTLKQELAKLPERPVSVPDRFKGFHSSIKPKDEGWNLWFPLNRRTTSIALYPAVCLNGKEIESYAFPKRFTITAYPREGGEPIIVADWSQTDFPQEGISPVIFPFKSERYDGVGLTVHKGFPMSGGHAFALAEVSFSRRFNTDLIPLRIPSPAEDYLNFPPYWSAAYAADGRTAFGSPAPAADASDSTFRVYGQETNRVQILIRQSKSTHWNSLEFHPTCNSDDLPPDGFPTGFQVEFSDQDDFSQILRTEQTTDEVVLPNGDYPYVFEFTDVVARCLRITFRPSPSSGKRIELEEITFNGGIPLQMKGWYFGDKDIAGPPGTKALYDRIINGNYWHTPVRQTVNLIRRDILSEELHRVESTMQSLRLAHERTLATIKAGSIILVSSLLGLIILHQRRQSKKAQLRIRHRIQQDLHDEIGSHLSTISMISNFNKQAPGLDPELRNELTDINQSAREAVASLTEVIWLTDKEILTLTQCFEVMKKRAVKMVHTVHLDLDFPQKVPPIELSFRTKRNLILLFTEALNNALKHSNADTISVQAQIDPSRQLTLVVADNGHGFLPDSVDSGIGLESMRERAQKLGGQLDITSSPEQGTTVTYRGKL